jgi:hypothetical protein
MSDAVKAALREAVEGYDAARMAAHGQSGERHSMSDRNKETITPMIAAAVAAFHRRMAEHWKGFAPDWQARHTQMADSVERAAQEDKR